MRFVTATASLRGNREQNQDRCAVLWEGECALLLLADGMGGHPRGDLAAQRVIDVGRAAFHTALKPIAHPGEFLGELLQIAHEQIIALGNRHQPPIDPRTTAVVALVQNGVAYWSHVGDSRLYLMRHGRIWTRTQDHSFVEGLRLHGMPDSATLSGMRHLVTRCLGGRGGHFQPSPGQPIPLLPRDFLLLCSDGLWGQLSEPYLVQRLRRHPGPLERLVEDLAQVAEQAGFPASDNVSLVVLRWLGETPDTLDT